MSWRGCTSTGKTLFRDSHLTTSQPGCREINLSIPANSNLTAASIKMPTVKTKSGLAIGLNHGHKVTPHQPKTKISRAKGRLSKRTAFCREIVREVCGMAPYERRVVELLRNSKDKRARKLAKKRLGTFGRAKRKVDEMTKIITESRRAAGH